MKKVHFVSVDGKTACGRIVEDAFLTSNTAEVTCGNCNRTIVFKTANGDIPAVEAEAEAEVEAE